MIDLPDNIYEGIAVLRTMNRVGLISDSEYHDPKTVIRYLFEDGFYETSMWIFDHKEDYLTGLKEGFTCFGDGCDSVHFAEEMMTLEWGNKKEDKSVN